MLDVLKARWQTRGWHVMDKADSEPMALEFIRELDMASVPYQHYRELYHRSIEMRARRLEQGLSCDDFSVDMMLACWPPLKAEMQQREIDAGRTLTESAKTQCSRCFGTGIENKFDIDGRVLGAIMGRRCDHRSPVEGEGLWSYLDRAKKAAPPRAVDLV